MDIEKLYKIYKKYPLISIDSRKLEKNSIFFALKGENLDGNTFASSAIKKCQYAVIDNKEYYINDRTILVDNCLHTLQKLANLHRKQFNIPVIALTGTNGKTTTKELIKTVLASKFRITATTGNFNNHIGVPLTLLQIDSKTEIAIIEMGANHLGEINTLCEITEPNFGLITNIGHAHLDGFGSFNNVVKAKNELYAYLISKLAVIFQNVDNVILTSLTKNYKTVNYSINNIQLNRNQKENIYLEFDYNRQEIKTNLVGNYNLENVLAAITIGEYFSISNREIARAITKYKPSNIRSQLLKSKYNSIIIDAYNANPSSMKASLNNFTLVTIPYKILILGDMFELGKNSSEEHKKILELIKDSDFEKVILCGKEFYQHASNYDFTFFLEKKDLLTYLKKVNIQKKIVLVKGSRGMQLESVLKYL